MRDTNSCTRILMNQNGTRWTAVNPVQSFIAINPLRASGKRLLTEKKLEVELTVPKIGQQFQQNSQKLDCKILQ